MLKALTVRNFALVERLDIEFGPGLSVITGESGAGKSILLDALSLVLGARARRGQIRPGADGCDVSAEFDVSGRPRAREVLAEQSVLDPDAPEACLVRRACSASGRSRAFLNGAPVPAGVLQRLAEPLVDIHGQDGHRLILHANAQRRLLDDFGAEAGLVDAVAGAYRRWVRCRRDLDDARAAAAQRRERRALLSYQTEELEALAGDLERFEEITADHRRLSRAREIVAAVGGAAAEIDDDLASRAARIARLMADTGDEHPKLNQARELMASVEACLEEAGDELRGYLDGFDAADETLADLEVRLTAVHDAARKHRVPAASLAQHFAALREELAGLDDEDARVETLEGALEAARDDFLESARSLSAQRRAAAAPFAERVTAAMRELGLKDGSLDVRFPQAESAAGLEGVEYAVTTNPRYPPGRLADIASGGELSRIGLAIQVVAAERSALPCMILDEADIGIGGTMADVLGRLLKRLARTTQVIAVTHAPQIAALADQHLKVSKTAAQDTDIAALGEGERVEELARMLGGRTVSDESRSYAATLLAQAREPADAA